MIKKSTLNCTVLGAGSWGITLAILLQENGHNVTLWEVFPKAFENLLRFREEKDKLPGIILPQGITITNDLSKSLQSADLAVLAVPSQFLRKTMQTAGDHDFSKKIVVNMVKGIEVNTLKRVSEILFHENRSITSANYAILSGPSHAEEVVRRVPTTIVAASLNSDAALLVQKTFTRPYLRVYTNNDVVGVELAGALKNVIAIAAGVLDGLGYGDNTKGALLTRGMVEITRLGMAMGAKQETFFGLAGIGDLITTCISRHSRNRHVGEKLGQGQKLDTILQEMKMVAEGVDTTRSAFELARKAGIEMPITERMYHLLFQGEDPHLAVKSLMERELKAEAL